MKTFPDDLEDDEDEELITPDSFGDDEDSDYYNDEDDEDSNDFRILLNYDPIW